MSTETQKVDVIDDLEAIGAYFADRSDVRDGSYGEQVPNIEMTLEQATKRVQRAVAELIEQNKLLREGIEAVATLIDESYGVSGLHLNGDVANWGDLRSGGRFEPWLLAFDEALARVGGAA